MPVKAHTTQEITNEKLALLLIDVAPFLGVNVNTGKSVYDSEENNPGKNKLVEIISQYYHDWAEIMSLVKGTNRKFYTGDLDALGRLKIGLIDLLEKRFKIYDLRIDCDYEQLQSLQKEYVNFKKNFDHGVYEEHFIWLFRACVYEDANLQNLKEFKTTLEKRAKSYYNNQLSHARKMQRKAEKSFREMVKLNPENSVPHIFDKINVQMVKIHLFLSI